MTILYHPLPEPVFHRELGEHGEYVATFPDGYEVFGETRARCNDRIAEALRTRGKHAITTAPIFVGAPARPLRDLGPDEIMDMAPGEFALSYLADGCEDCEKGPRESCSLRGRCDAETFGR